MNKHFPKLVFILALFISLSVAACAEKAPLNDPSQLQIIGSTSVMPLADKLADAYMESHPQTLIQVQGGGTSVGISSTGEGIVEMGSASREMLAGEQQKYPDLKHFTIAFDGIAIITHPDTELTTLSLEQIRAIFSGEITNFSQVGGNDAEIVIVAREEGSGTRAMFENLVMSQNGQTSPIRSSAILQNSNGAVRTTVAETPHAISFLSMAYLDESVNVVAVDGVLPDLETLQENSYPLIRPLFLLSRGEPQGITRDFLNYVISPEGQEIVRQQGYLPAEP
jgi:phosphate transport system substrate-binding protein